MTAIDFGLESGVCRQWQNKQLLDYTLQVEDQEFHVHKLVLISVSDYFRAMLCGSMKESCADRVELPGLNAAVVSKTLELIYTGKADIVTGHAAEILECATYLQMPLVIKVCVRTLLNGVNVQNCLDVLSTCVTYAFCEEAERVKTFIRSKWMAVMEHYIPEKLSYDSLRLIILSWGQSEWDLFLYIKNWINVDVENRRLHSDLLLSQVKFPLMTLVEIVEITHMDLFVKSDGAWCKLVHEAVQYHKLPIHHKVSNTSEQTNTRREPLPVVFITSNGKPKSMYSLDKDSLYKLDGEDCWKEHKGGTAPDFIEATPVVVDVNNFLIVCSGVDTDQRWDVFDPRMIYWSPMAKMNTPKTGFALVHHNEKLYALGGQTSSSSKIESLTDGVEEYSFQTGTWCVVNKLPFVVSKHAACVYGDSVYVSGGFRDENGKYTCSKDLNCLDLKNGTSEKKAPMPKKLDEHQMLVMTLCSEEVIVVINYSFKIHSYNPTNNQWSVFRPEVSSTKELHLQWCDEAIMLAKGNTVFFLNIMTTDKDSDSDSDSSDSDSGAWTLFKQDCVRWQFSKKEAAMTEVYLQRFPWRGELDIEGVNAFGAVFSLNMK